MSRLLTGFLIASFALVAGCGDSGPTLYPVNGTVKLDGSAKASLLVTFTPVDGGPSAVGQTNDRGEYNLITNGRRGAVEGKHKVSITTIHENPQNATAKSSAPSGGADYMNQANIRPSEQKIPKELIPPKYNTASELVKEVNSSNRVIDFELTTK